MPEIRKRLMKIIVAVTLAIFTLTSLGTAQADHKCNDGVWGACDGGEETLGGGAAGGGSPPPSTTTLPPPPPPDPEEWRRLLGLPEDAVLIEHIPYGLPETLLWNLYPGWAVSILIPENSFFKIIVFMKATTPTSIRFDFIIVIRDDDYGWAYVKGWTVRRSSPPPAHVWYPDGWEGGEEGGINMNYVPPDWAFQLEQTTTPILAAGEYGIRVGFEEGEPMPASTRVCSSRVPADGSPPACW